MPRPRRLRGYSKAFTPSDGIGQRYLLDKIPTPLWSAARVRAQREGISMRALLLQLLEKWADRPVNHNA